MPSGCLPEPFCEMGVIWGKEMMCVQLGKILDKIQRDQRALFPLLKGRQQKQEVRSKSRVLHTAPPKGWANHLSQTSSLTLDTPLSSPHRNNQLFTPR